MAPMRSLRSLRPWSWASACSSSSRPWTAEGRPSAGSLDALRARPLRQP